MKNISKCIIENMDKKRKYSLEEKIVIEYGIELFLDSAVKAILYIGVGIIIGRIKETFCALIVWCMIRKQSGGRHAKNNFICFMISGSAIFFPIILSAFWKITTEISAISMIIVNYVYILYAPYDEYFTYEEHKQESQCSGGEWQRIAIGRALFNKNAEIYFFDEPDAALDVIKQKEIYELIRNKTKNKICIYVSHAAADEWEKILEKMIREFREADEKK